MGNNTYPKAMSQGEGPGCPCQEGARARALHAPEPALELIALASTLLSHGWNGPSLCRIRCIRHKAHQHGRCTAGSVGESQEAASGEVVFLLEKPPPCLLQPQADDTAPTCSTATFLHGLQLEPSSGWMAAVSINPEVRKAEKQFKNLCRKKPKPQNTHLLPHPAARRHQPQHNALQPHTNSCFPRKPETPLPALKRDPRVKTPPVSTVRA